jgi:sensor histidine kinase YesM
MTFAAQQIIERLGGEFSQVERLSYGLKQNDDVKTLMSEGDPGNFYVIAGKVEDTLGAGAFNQDFIDSIVLYGADRNYYRLTGKLGNKSCTRLANTVFSLDMPSHLSIELEGKKYIGYADEIVLGGGKTGAVVILMEDEKILEILRAYDQSGSLMVVIQSGGEVVAANTNMTNLSAVEWQPAVHSRFGITPYEISVAAESQYLNNSVMYFSVVAIITAAIFGAVLFMYATLLDRRFFRPMVSVIGSIENLNTSDNTESLPYVQSKEFDGLIAKINEMLHDIDTKNTAVKGAELRAKNAEIERQKALVFSLKKQINAHFTVNTLEAIRSLVEQGEIEKAETVATGLIHLVRYAYDKDELINIWDEFGILQSYIAIMNSRYGGKLDVDFDFDDYLMDYSMPRMLLQPVIENAVSHGFRDMESGCEISVKAQLQGDRIVFTVSDNGCGMSADELSALDKRFSENTEAAQGYESIALLNIKNRLYHYYGGAGQLHVHSNRNGGIGVVIVIPSMIGSEGLA